MNTQALDLLERHQVCSLTVLLPNGSPHAAAVHFSHVADPLTLYFSTDRTSKKCQGLLNGQSAKSSIVVGFSEEEWKTLQMDGEVKAILDKDELKKVQIVHYAKHPDAEKYKNDPDTLFLSFTPGWWRYSDLKIHPPAIISSDT